MTPTPSVSHLNLPGAVVVDANVAVAIAAKEARRDLKATTELNTYIAQGCELFAPGAITTETLYALCQKYQTGLLTAVEHDTAVSAFDVLMGIIQPPPYGEAALIRRAYKICDSYGCSRSADAVYIALAEKLTVMRATVLLTFDHGMLNQASKNSPTVIVKLLTI